MKTCLKTKVILELIKAHPWMLPKPHLWKWFKKNQMSATISRAKVKEIHTDLQMQLPPIMFLNQILRPRKEVGFLMVKVKKVWLKAILKYSERQGKDLKWHEGRCSRIWTTRTKRLHKWCKQLMRLDAQVMKRGVQSFLWWKAILEWFHLLWTYLI
jgi:hypothetical protein